MAHPGIELHGSDDEDHPVDTMAPRMAAAGLTHSVQPHTSHTDDTDHTVNNTTVASSLNALHPIPNVAAFSHNGLVPPSSRLTNTNSVMTFHEIAAKTASLCCTSPPPATREKRPPREFLLHHKYPQAGAQDNSAMVHYMIATGFLVDPAPHYLYADEAALVKWYTNDLIDKLNALLDLDADRGTGIVGKIISVKFKARQAAFPHQALLKWCRTGLRKQIRFRLHADWVGLLLQFNMTAELRIYDLMGLITEAYRRVHENVIVGSFTYSPPADIAAIWAAQTIPQPSLVAKSPSLSAATSSTTTQSQAASELTLPTEASSPGRPEQTHHHQIFCDISPSARHSIEATSGTGIGISEDEGVMLQPAYERAAVPAAPQTAPVMNKGKRKAQDEIKDNVRPTKQVCHDDLLAQETITSHPEVPQSASMLGSPGKRKAEEELEDNAQPSKIAREATPLVLETIDTVIYHHEDLSPIDMPWDQGIWPFYLPTVEDNNPMYGVDQSLIESWIAELRQIKWTKDDIWFRGKIYQDLPLDVEEERSKLRTYLEPIQFLDEEIAPLFRDMAMPDDDDLTELARCIRFARSASQQNIDWRVYPFHVLEMGKRTNKYGIELLRSRTSMSSQDWEDVDWEAERRAEVVMRFAKLPTTTLDLTVANIEHVYGELEAEDMVLNLLADDGPT